MKILRGRLQLGVAIDDDSLICGTGRERERQRVKREKKCELEKIEGESGGRCVCRRKGTGFVRR